MKNTTTHVWKLIIICQCATVRVCPKYSLKSIFACAEIPSVNRLESSV